MLATHPASPSEPVEAACRTLQPMHHTSLKPEELVYLVVTSTKGFF